MGYPSGQRRSPDRLSTDPYSQRWKLQKPQIQNRQKPLRTLQKHRLRLNQPWFQTRSLRNWRSRELRVSILQGNFIGLGKILDLYLISTPWQIESSWPPWQEMFARIDVDKSNTITKEEVWLWAQWGLLSMAWGLLQDVARMIVMGYNIIGENKICSEQYDDGFPELILTFSTDWKTRGHHIWKNSGNCWQSCWDELQESYKSAIAARITCSIAYQELSYLPSLLGIIFIIHRKMHQPTRTIRWDRGFSHGSSKVDLPKFSNPSQHLPDALPTGCVFDWVTHIYIYIYEQGSKDAMKGFNYDPPSLLKICDLLCVAIGGLM